MKMKPLYSKQKLLAAAVCFFLFAARGNAQTGILVTYYNGTEQAYSVATSGKLYFESSNLQIVLTDAATPVSIPVSIIRKITFLPAALPLRMVDFTLLNEKAQVALSWKTENEVNTSHFVIERSVDGINYESIGLVAAFNNTIAGSYSFADQAPKTGTSYYRLKQVDADGKYEYSKVLTVKRTTTDIITLLPNPATDYIRINSTTTERLNVKIYSADGRLMITGTYTTGEQISIGKLTPGMYVATINDKTYKLIKQ